MHLGVQNSNKAVIANVVISKNNKITQGSHGVDVRGSFWMIMQDWHVILMDIIRESMQYAGDVKT